jgi:hypothetical protein
VKKEGEGDEVEAEDEYFFPHILSFYRSLAATRRRGVCFPILASHLGFALARQYALVFTGATE